MPNLVASAEATVKLDFFRRVGEKRKDTSAVAHRDWHKGLSAGKQLRPDFDRGGILEVLRQAGVMDKIIIREYRECLRARHWVGHGRSWAKPGGVDRFDPDDVHARSDALIQSLPD